MQKILILVLFVTILPIYVFAETYDKSKCDIIETDENVIDKLREQGIYKENKTGVVCFNIEGSSFMFPLKNGKTEGIQKSYIAGFLFTEIPYKNGKAEGIGKTYYESGALIQEMPYKNGKAEGIGKTYYESGALKYEIPFKNDKAEGIEKWYYESGALMEETPFKNDIKEGIGKSYKEDGRLFFTLTYQNDKVISGKCANGRKWTNAEINNFEKGLYVNCGR